MRPQLIRIHSEDNDFQYAETLRRNRTKRQKRREFFVEGVRPINLALEHGWEIRAFLFSRERPLSSWAEGVLRQSAAKAHYELPLHLMAKLSGKEETSELIALAAMPPDDLSRIPVREDLLVVVFDRPASPGNLGTIIRSCDALGAHGLIVTGHAADVYSPEVVSGSTGSLFATPVVRLPSHQELLPWFDVIQTAIGDFQVVGSSARADTDLSALNLMRPTVLVVGNETRGLSEAYRELCDVLIRISMGGAATSLNVACATSIMLYEVDAQRREKSGRRRASRG
ncbi:MAG: rRNA methyltransferase [Chloroflexia bacterium]|nr:rRNA methyltransferase [Chloroflexia bacterium]